MSVRVPEGGGVYDSCILIESFMEFMGLMSLRPEGVIVRSLNILFFSDRFLAELSSDVEIPVW